MSNTQTFTYTYFVNRPLGTGNGDAAYSKDLSNTNVTITDTDDGGGDNVSILGDIPGDGAVDDFGSSTYVGMTTNGDLVTYDSVFGAYIVYSNTDYGSNPTFDVVEGGTFDLVCYASGAMIRTVRGEVAVEALAVGDLVVTTSGAERPIKWIGSRTLDLGHPALFHAQPVVIRAGALGQNRPYADLRVSPDHAMAVTLVDEVLVPARALLNGATIVRDRAETVTYWHVELDGHDLLIANGVASESYLEAGNRGFFSGEGDALPGETATGTPDYCRPVAGPDDLTFIRRRLNARAEALGYRPDRTPELVIEIDDVGVPALIGEKSALVRIPAAAGRVMIRSDLFVPAEQGGQDNRALGLALRALSIQDECGQPLSLALDDPRLQADLHGPEQGHPGRWTQGSLTLTPDLWAGLTGDLALMIAFSATAVRRWIAPEGVSEAAEAPPRLRIVA